MTFGDRLIKALKDKSLSQKDLADMMQIRRTSITDWKQGKTFPLADTAVKIATILGVTVEYLVTGKPPSGLSEDSLKIAHTAEKLSPEGRDIALGQVEALLKRFPCVASRSSKKGG